jgi:hypothetical protein
MTDVSPGPGWWLASDGQWYPPHLHPDARAHDEGQRNGDTPAATEATAATAATATTPTTAPLQYVPEREPIDWARVAEERAARRQQQESRGQRKFSGALLGAALVTVVALGVLWLVARNDNDGDITDQDGTAQSGTSTTVASETTGTTPATATTAAPGVTTTVPGTVSVFSLQPGDCVQNSELFSGRVTTVVEVPCEQAHTHEVFHKVTYTPPDGAYDEGRISQFASEQCTQSFATYVGVPFDRSKYYYVQFSPTQESWTQQGDREVMCLLFLQGSELTGSAKGTAQ